MDHLPIGKRTENKTGTAQPRKRSARWIPLDGTRFPDVRVGAGIVVQFRDGSTGASEAGLLLYSHTGSCADIMAWRRA